MIKNIPVKVDVSAVKDLPKIEKEMETIARELKKLPNDKELLADLKKQQKAFNDIEAALAANLAKLEALHKDLTDAITPLHKRTDLPASLKGDIAKLFNVCTNSRGKELKDLATAQRKKELHTNPTKIVRVCDDLNGDAVEFNKIEAVLDKAIDDEFAEKWKQVEAAITKLCSDAKPPVNPAAVDAARVLKTKFEALKKARWKDYEAKVKAMTLEFAKEIANVSRQAEIRGLIPSYLKLNRKVRDRILDAALAGTLTAAATRKELDDAFAAQQKPSKSQWTQHLGMTGYNFGTVTGKHDGVDIHVTWDKKSWSADSNGGIDVGANNADAIMHKLFGTVKWDVQVHATLELVNSNGKRPHVYWGGVTNNWELTAEEYEKDDAWIKAGKMAVKAVLDKAKANIKVDVQKAIDACGDI